MTQRKPPELKALAGTDRQDRAESGISSLLPRLDVAPSPPDWLTLPEAVREWSALAPTLVACALLRPTMVSSLGHLCQLHAVLVEAYRAGEPPKAALVAAYTRLAGLFGLTAVDARRLPSPDRARGQNRFAKFKAGV